VYDLLETRNGDLWVGTSAGLDLFDRADGRFIHFPYQDGDPGGLSGKVAYRLFEDSQGRIWVSSLDAGLDRFEFQNGSITHVAHFHPGTDDPQNLSGTGVLAITEDRAGVLWVGLRGRGLCRFDAVEQDFVCYNNDPGKANSLSAGQVTSLYEDRSGILWVGTYGGGANKLDPGYKPFVNIENNPQDPVSLSGNMVFAIYQDAQGILWVGEDGTGLDRIDLATGMVANYRNDPRDPTSLAGHNVHYIYQDRVGVLWIGSNAGLDRMDPSTGTFMHYQHNPEDPTSLPGNDITGICEDRSGKFWIGTRMGFALLDRATGRVTRYQNKPGDLNSLSNNSVSTLLADSRGYLWVGTVFSGMDRFDPRTGNFLHIPGNPNDLQALSDPYVMSIFEDSAGTIWVGTTAGLNRLDWQPQIDKAVIRQYRVKDGLPNDFIYAIEEDTSAKPSHLWVSTNKGLARLDQKTGQFKNFVAKDGLQSSEFNMGASFKSSSGEMFFGGIQGITHFYPQQIRENPYIPPVVLTSLTQHGEPLNAQISRAEEISLRWPDNYFDFEFSALNYTRPEDNQYAYRLDGLDSAWNIIGTKRSGRYTNLSGGTYTLRLKGSNNDGLWNEAGAAIRVRVIPPFWATWWFRGAFAMLVAGAVAGGVRLRIRGVVSRNQDLEKLVSARTVEIQKLSEQTKELAIIEERNRLARDLHDSAKQKAFAALAQLGAANGLLRADLPRANSALREAETLVYEVIEELTFLIQEMYPVELKEKGLPTVLREYIFEWESRCEIQVTFDLINTYPLSLKVEQALYRIVQEALANIARHSRATRVDIMLEYLPGQVNLTIADNGQGFDMSHRPSGVGLRSMQERIYMVGGKLMIESLPGQGTRVVASAPTAQNVARETQPMDRIGEKP
jgi:signal transduction histidine kinase/ligand-binding sensor domain-containing protein